MIRNHSRGKKIERLDPDIFPPEILNIIHCQEVDKKMEWIKTEQELPPISEAVLGCWEDGTTEVVILEDIDENGDPMFCFSLTGVEPQWIPDYWCEIIPPEEE